MSYALSTDENNISFTNILLFLLQTRLFVRIVLSRYGYNILRVLFHTFLLFDRSLLMCSKNFVHAGWVSGCGV